MSAVLRFTILGCGSSGGVPRVDGDWGDCDPREPKNRRRRCSLLAERAESEAALKTGEATRLLIDTSPDLREQLLDAQVSTLDGLAFTHDHADQSHGIDDVRAIVYRRAKRLPAFMNAHTRAQLTTRFGYIFETPPGSGYPPLLELQAMEDGAEHAIDGPGGRLSFTSFTVAHGSIPCAGIRIGPAAYTPDVSGMPDAAFEAIEGVSLWIVDALRDKPHPSHAHLALSLEWLARAKPALGVLTNLHIDLDYRALAKRCPDGVRPSYDGMQVTLREGDGEILSASKA